MPEFEIYRITLRCETLAPSSLVPGELFYKEMQRRWITVRSMFKQIDFDNSGCISMDELYEYIAGGAIDTLNADNFGMTEVQAMFDIIDADKSGHVELVEFELFFEQVAKSIRKRSGGTGTVLRHVPVAGSDNPDAKMVALVAHNNMKKMMATFVENNLPFFSQLKIVTTGTTGKSLEEKLGLKIEKKVKSGPLGGDQEIGGLVANGKVAGVFFFKDPLTIQAHNADIEALVRLCDVHQVPFATNASTARCLLMGLQSFGLDGCLQEIGEDSAVIAYQMGQKAVLHNVVNAVTAVGAFKDTLAHPIQGSTSESPAPAD